MAADAGNVMSVDQDLTGSGTFFTGEQFDQGRFAGSALPDDEYELSPVDGKAHVSECFGAIGLIRHADVAEFDQFWRLLSIFRVQLRHHFPLSWWKAFRSCFSRYLRTMNASLNSTASSKLRKSSAVF